MKYRKIISFLVLLIVILSLVTSISGIFYSDSNEVFQFKSIFGETIEVYSKGIYKYNSISLVAQGIAQDIVTMVLGIPLLLISILLVLINGANGVSPPKIFNIIAGLSLLTGVIGQKAGIILTAGQTRRIELRNWKIIPFDYISKLGKKFKTDHEHDKF